MTAVCYSLAAGLLVAGCLLDCSMIDEDALCLVGKLAADCDLARSAISAS